MSRASAMCSVPIHATPTGGGAVVSTVLIEPFGYYETAIIRRGKPAQIVESFIADVETAEALHRAAVEEMMP